VAAVPGAAVAQQGFDLFAGQDILVGCVYVSSDSDSVMVEFDTAADCQGNPTGWPITETHVAVSGSAEGIPQTKKGNPIPGKFPYQNDHNPAVTSFVYDVPYNVLTNGTQIIVAAHAVVWDPSSGGTLQVCSDGDESYTAYNNYDLGPDAGAPEPRYGTAKPSAEPYGIQVDTEPSLWDLNVAPPFFNATGATGCADWVWEDNFKFRGTDTPCDPAIDGADCINQAVNPTNGDRVEFTETFHLPGPAMAGMLSVTCDNAYEAYLNTTTPGAPLLSGQTGSSATFPDWWRSDLRQPSVKTGGWQSVESVSPAGFVVGDNFLFFRAANEEMANGADLWCDTGAFVNPAGIIWQLDIRYARKSETAWGGCDEFPGKNWATFIVYQAPN
jgi:hypothetical protein